MTLEIEVVNRPARGEKVSGDGWVVRQRDGISLVGLADGLGHGPMAAEASGAFCDHIDAQPMTRPVDELMRSCKTPVSRTRGAAAALLFIDEEAQRVSFSGVGNIELQAVSLEKIRPVSTPGIVGRPVRKYLRFDYSLNDGDLLALYSDGISSRFQLADYRRLDLKECAEAILSNHGKHHDDATCILLKYRRSRTTASGEG